ncbi:MAG: hypothetical protein AB3N20_12115 [Rhizobiaceae bacterium]
MITWWLKRKFDEMGREYDYDVSYMHELAEADPAALRKFALAMPFFTQPPRASAHACWAAKLRSCKHADCGPCLRLVIDMARRFGTEDQTIREILIGTPVDHDAALGQAYADAVLGNSPELPELINKIESRWGKKGLASMSAAVMSGQFFPVFKRGFGHGMACEPVLKELEAKIAA